MDLQAIADKVEIHELLARYARGVDTKDWGLFRSVFTPEAILDYSSAGIAAGTRDEVAGWFEAGFERIAMTQHFISNIEVDLAPNGDAQRATVRAMFYNPMLLPGMDEQSYCGGNYTHEMVRTDEGWKSERLVEENLWFVNRPNMTLETS